jgi:hypothetical protein
LIDRVVSYTHLICQCYNRWLLFPL